MLDILWVAIGFVAVLWIWPTAWKSGVDGKVDCVIEFPRHECDIGEGVPFTVTLINRSHFPIPFAEIEIDLPKELSFHPQEERSRRAFATYVLMRRRVRVEFTLYGFRRGPTAVRDVSIRLHEGFGINRLYLSGQASSTVAVRPRPAQFTRYRLPVSMQGDMPMEHVVFPDETLLKGVRPYQFGDPARHIHWRASARLGQIVSKQFFSSTEPRALLILNAQFTDPYWMKTGSPAFDGLCEKVLGAAIELEKRGTQVWFATNAACGGKQRIVFSQLTASRIASLLGHAHAIATSPLDSVLDALLHPAKARMPLVFLFSQYETEEQSGRLQMLRKRGTSVEAIRVGGAANE
ncbi:DUF58 domain-containing protein [Alicyclobacillus acidiphilus]|uniref:DUF58 domain-containing protein n=1 Tax=Alicyclobacillus acidiphilus TaxID=182455 RepID=UPI000832B0A4|nr:DUF58 domain-containing protein [Alicyclobacillus acidiphilus]